MGAPTNEEIRKALIRMARAQRAYHAAHAKQTTAGTLMGPDGFLTGEAARTAHLHGDAERVVTGMAEQLLKIDTAMRRVAAGKAFEYPTTLLDSDVVVTFTVDRGVEGGGLEVESVEVQDGEATPEAVLEHLKDHEKEREELIEEARKAWAEGMAEDEEARREAAAELAGDEQREQAHGIGF